MFCSVTVYLIFCIHFIDSNVIMHSTINESNELKGVNKSVVADLKIMNNNNTITNIDSLDDNTSTSSYNIPYGNIVLSTSWNNTHSVTSSNDFETIEDNCVHQPQKILPDGAHSAEIM